MAKIRQVEGKRSIMDIDLLLENPKNANEHPQTQIDDIIESIKLLWFRGEITIDENNTILAGHGRVEAGRQMGLKKLPVVQYTDLSEAEKISLMNLDNRLQAGSTLNIEKLQENFIDIELLGGKISNLEKDLFDFAIPDIEIADVKIDTGNIGGSIGDDLEVDPNTVGPTYSKPTDTGESLEESKAEYQEGEKKPQIRSIQVAVRDEIYDETFDLYRDLLKRDIDIGDLLLEALKMKKNTGEN